MTMQCPEILFHRGVKLKLYYDPLEEYLKTAIIPFRFYSDCSACWRGYVGTWTIKQDRLYIISLEGTIETASGIETVDLKALFPECQDSVFADGFSGELYSPTGDHWGHMVGLEKLNGTEQDLVIEVQQGIIMSERLVAYTGEEVFRRYMASMGIIK
jgi:hypothetical protein